MDRYTYGVEYRTRVVEVTKVNMVGVLSYVSRDEDMGGPVGGWSVAETGISKTVRSIEEWFEKFDGKRVRILIELVDGEQDESHLLPEDTQS